MNKTCGKTRCVLFLTLIGVIFLLTSCSSNNNPQDEEVLPGVPSVMQYDDYYSCANAKEVLSADENIIEVTSVAKEPNERL